MGFEEITIGKIRSPDIFYFVPVHENCKVHKNQVKEMNEGNLISIPEGDWLPSRRSETQKAVQLNKLQQDIHVYFPKARQHTSEDEPPSLV